VKGEAEKGKVRRKKEEGKENLQAETESYNCKLQRN